MASEVNEERRNGIAVLELNRPVENALAPSLRQELAQSLETAFSDPAVQAIVLKGAGQGFSSGLDIAEYDGPLKDPWVGDLCHLIEDAPKPVVAALHGAVLGGGFELALAAHARVAAGSARVALPEVTLGLIPGAGGTQRLARIAGAQVALEVLLSGRATDARDARLRRVFDRLVDGDPLEDALTLAREMAVSGTWTRTKDREAGLSDPDGYQQAVQGVGGRVADTDSAERDILKCVEAAQLLPFEQGIIFERALFDDRIKSQSARASRHAFVAQRRAGVMPELSKGKARPVKQVVLLGGGALTVELAIQGLDAGQAVTLVMRSQQQADAIMDRVATIYASAVDRKRLDPGVRDHRLARLNRGAFPASLAQADMVLDDGSFDLGDGALTLKPSVVWASLHGVLPDHDRIAAAQASTNHVVLNHSRPAHITGLIELAVPNATHPDTVATIVRSFADAGQTVVRSALVPGLLRENLFFALFGAALTLCRAGGAPDAIDKAAQELGFRNGPFETADKLGLPQVHSRFKVLCDARSRKIPEGLAVLSARIASGAKGRAVGKGIFLYDEGTMRPDPALMDWLAGWRSEGQEAMPDGMDMKPALHAAFVNEAARLIADECVLRVADIDVVAVKGMGFDRRLGGPLLQADFVGIFAILQDMKRFAPLDPDIWGAHPKVLDMVKYGEGFVERGR
jgi:3-hydroxyacyl-CoA dehydrogenase